MLLNVQEVFYFPLKTKLQSLLKVPAYRKLIEHEYERAKKKDDDDLMADVYDSQAWQDFMGPAVSPNDRMGTCNNLEANLNKIKYY